MRSAAVSRPRTPLVRRARAPRMWAPQGHSSAAQLSPLGHDRGESERIRGSRARAASHPGSQHVDLTARRERVEAVLDQPANPQQASQRPPRADHVEVDVGAVAGDDVAEVLLVSERQGGEVEQGITLARLGPVDDARDLVAVDEDVRRSAGRRA